MENSSLDKLAQANENIETLIEKIVSLRRENVGNNCYKGALADREECSGRCNDCEDEYFDKLYENMLKKYIVE